MDRLPQEIIDNIVELLPSFRHFPYGGLIWEKFNFSTVATVSRAFQLAVERKTFRVLVLPSTEITEFERMLSVPHRRDILRCLHFRVQLPIVDYDKSKFWTDDDRQRNSETVTNAVRSIFNLLSGMSQDLSIEFHISMDMLTAKHHDIDTWGHSYIEIQSPQSLPEIPCIHSLEIRLLQSLFKMHPASMFNVAKKLPNLKRVHFEYMEPELFLNFRNQMTDRLVMSLADFQWPASMQEAKFEIVPPCLVYRQPLPVAIDASGNPLCSTVRRISDTFTTLKYDGQVAPSFFWPSDNPGSFWQSMKTMSIGFNMASPLGGWYFASTVEPYFDGKAVAAVDTKQLLPPGYNKTAQEDESAVKMRGEWNQRQSEARTTVAYAAWAPNFREKWGTKLKWVVNGDLMVPLLESMAKAMLQMRSLESLVLYIDRADFWDRGEDIWFIEYKAPGLVGTEHHRLEAVQDSALDKPRFYLQVRGWQPPSELLGLLRKVGREHHGQDAVLLFLDPSLKSSQNLFVKTFE